MTGPRARGGSSRLETRERPADAAHPAGDDAALLYLYGIVEADSEAARLLARRAVRGLDPAEPLFPITVGDLMAAVSRVPAATFEEEPLNALVADLPRLAPLAVQHEETVRALLPAAPALVPMAFGAMYRGPARVEALLRERGDEFRALLGRVRGKYEWGLKVYRDAARWLASADEASDELRRLANEIARTSPGRAYLLGKQRERLRAAEADRLAAAALDEMLSRLEALSAASRRNPLGAAQPGSTQLLLNAAFLVETAATERFRTAAAELERVYGLRGLSGELSGPWAPYSFVGAGSGAA
ncbi:MAG TPA: GvpL/GvpF family gas vesicle protein [Chloroflexota bacterium]|jgi:hypothetical protein